VVLEVKVEVSDSFVELEENILSNEKVEEVVTTSGNFIL